MFWLLYLSLYGTANLTKDATKVDRNTKNVERHSSGEASVENRNKYTFFHSPLVRRISHCYDFAPKQNEFWFWLTCQKLWFKKQIIFSSLEFVEFLKKDCTGTGPDHGRDIIRSRIKRHQLKTPVALSHRHNRVARAWVTSRPVTTMVNETLQPSIYYNTRHDIYLPATVYRGLPCPYNTSADGRTRCIILPEIRTRGVMMCA